MPTERGNRLSARHQILVTSAGRKSGSVCRQRPVVSVVFVAPMVIMGGVVLIRDFRQSDVILLWRSGVTACHKAFARHLAGLAGSFRIRARAAYGPVIQSPGKGRRQRNSAEMRVE